jgi:uncharacterized protein YgiM (DUF1202 family)
MSIHRAPKLFIIFTLFALLLVAATQVAAVDVFGTVTCDSTALRYGAGEKYVTINTVGRGTELKLIGRNSDNSWLRVSIASNRRAAWIVASCIETNYDINLLEMPIKVGANSGFVDTKALNLRKGPGANFDVIITLNIRTVFDVTGRNADDSWVKVTLPGNVVGWLSTRYVVLNVDINTLPVVSETGIDDSLPDPLPVNNLKVGFVTQDSNVYFGPGDVYDIVDTRDAGEGVYLRGRNTPNTWLLIQLDNGDTGWISAGVVNTDFDTIQLPIIGNS